VAAPCHDVGVQAGTDYGCSNSSARCGYKPYIPCVSDGKDMLDAYEGHFRYSDDGYFDWRVEETRTDWFNMIKGNIDKNRPLQVPCIRWFAMGTGTIRMPIACI
jgi:hypothetical protein